MFGWIIVHVLVLANPTQPMPGVYFSTKEECMKVAAEFRGGRVMCVQAVVPAVRG